MWQSVFADIPIVIEHTGGEITDPFLFACCFVIMVDGLTEFQPHTDEVILQDIQREDALGETGQVFGADDRRVAAGAVAECGCIRSHGASR
jgi:hypothetical protein